ncbi:MAG TPA: hypothetical protein PLN54_05040 [Flavobacteriales bacterium]|nr:hypothetical protein [Flavobacteriales bacterium]
MGLLVSGGHGLIAMILTGIIVGNPLGTSSLIAFLLGTALVFISGLVSVPSGHHGVIKHFGEIQPDKLLNHGNHWIYPIAWIRDIEIVHVQAKALEGEALNQTLEFHIYDFPPIKARVNRVRWKVSNAAMQQDGFEPYKPDEVMEHVQDAVLVLGQSDSAVMFDILTKVQRTFRGLEELVNEELQRKGLPISIVDIGLPRVSSADPRFIEFCTRIAEINLWRRNMKMSGESFVNSFYREGDGSIKYSSHSVDVKDTIDKLKDYFKGR